MKESLQLPKTGLLRMEAILPFLPYKKPTIYQKIREGSFPAPVKLSRRCAAFHAEEIHAWLQAQGRADEKAA